MNKVAKVAVASAVAMVLGSTLAHSLLPGLLEAASAADKPEAKPTVSAASGKDLQDAQKDMQAQKWDDMLASLDKVQANPKKTDYDTYVMNQFYVTAYANKQQMDKAAASLDAIIASQYMPPDELKKRIVQACFVNYQLKNYDKAIEYGLRADKEGDATDQSQLVVAQSYYLKDDFKDTDQYVRGLVDTEIKAGQKPADEVLQLGLSSGIKLKDDASEQYWLQLLVTYHPKPEYWDNLLDTIFRQKLTDKQLLQVYRLSFEVGAMKRGADFSDMAQNALDQGSPGEAVAVLTKGFANNAFTDPAEKTKVQHTLDTAKKQAATDEPSLDKSESDAAASPNGDKLVGVGIAYLGYGHYDKAAKDIGAGLAKGVARDQQNDRLLLGIAQLKSGNKDGAITTFKSVTGDPVLERLATLWTLHAQEAAS